jgi:sulfur-oxidizing protein SoxY
MVSHPNITGMQIDYLTRSYIPEHYVKRIVISYNDKPLMAAEGRILFKRRSSLGLLL